MALAGSKHDFERHWRLGGEQDHQAQRVVRYSGRVSPFHLLLHRDGVSPNLTLLERGILQRVNANEAGIAAARLIVVATLIGWALAGCSAIELYQQSTTATSDAQAIATAATEDATRGGFGSGA